MKISGWVVALALGGFFLPLAYSLDVTRRGGPVLFVPDPNYAAIYSGKRAVEDRLKDGSSAEFRQVGVYRGKDGALSVCGEVNARNGFGAMAGYSRFYYINGGSAIVEDATGPDVMNALWRQGGCDGEPLAHTD